MFSGQPYPELEPGPVLREIPSLDLYRDEDPFRTPRLGEYRDWIDVLEFAAMKTGAFPEPLTFSLRALRALRPRRGDFDVVHDNQVLGYGLLGIARLGLPLVTSIHHPVSVDRRIELQAARGLSRLSKRRWYSFVRMQGRVARRVSQAGPILTVSASSRRDICGDFGADPASVRVIPLGVDTRLFHPAARAAGARPDRGGGQRGLADEGRDHAAARVPAAARRLPAAAATTRPPGWSWSASRPPAARPTSWSVSWGWHGHAEFRHGMGNTELAELLASAQIAVVPSLYEGFSLPAVEHMASGTPLVATTDRRAARGHRRRRRAGRAGRSRTSSPRRCGGCATARPSGSGSATPRCAGWPSGSPGPRSPAPPWRSTSGRSARRRDDRAAHRRREPGPADR